MKPDTSTPAWIQTWIAAHDGGWYLPMKLDPAHPLITENWPCHVCTQPFTPEDTAFVQPVTFEHAAVRHRWWAHHRECGATLYFDDPDSLRRVRPHDYETLPQERRDLVDKRLGLA